MRKIYVVSDTHFGHTTMLKIKDDNGKFIRAFDSVQDMNDCMLTRWNEKVRDNDIVYHLGDVCFGNWDANADILGKLSGRKRLVLGNHDDYKKLSHFFRKITAWRMFPEFNCVLTHVPMHMGVRVAGKKYKFGYNVHGHLHNNPAPTSRHICVCVEKIDYTPIDLEEMMQRFN